MTSTAKSLKCTEEKFFSMFPAPSAFGSFSSFSFPRVGFVSNRPQLS
uniref:Uncharacterized protein n=1 Tax=Anguilla anguilla TaxID=7936 RepID=A0A0E9RM62_ANGAN